MIVLGMATFILGALLGYHSDRDVPAPKAPQESSRQRIDKMMEKAAESKE